MSLHHKLGDKDDKQHTFIHRALHTMINITRRNNNYANEQL